MNYFYKVLIIIFINGMTAAFAQIVLGREISFQANTDIFTYLWFAAAWLVGALISSQFIQEKFIKKVTDARLELTIAIAPVVNTFLIPAMLYMIRFAKPVLGLAPDAVMPLAALINICLIVFIPVSMAVVTGFLAALEVLKRKKAQKQANNLFLFEAAGIFIALAIYMSFLKARTADIDIIYTLGMANLAMVYLIFRGKTIEARYTMLAVIVAAIIYFGFNIAGIKDKAEITSSRAAYGGYFVIADKEYPTVKFTFAKKGETYYVFEDGKLSYKVDDPRYEKLAWMAEGPKVLVINGGLAGMTSALCRLKGIKEITAIESDAYTGYLLQNILKPEIPKDKKVEDLTGGIAAVKAGSLYSSVLINYRTPDSGMYKASYFAKVKTMLSPGAVLVMALPAAKDEKIAAAIRANFSSVNETDGVIIAK